MKTDNFNLIKDQIKTGDCLAFSGKGGISDLIKMVTFSSISHVGMAITLNYPDPDKPTLYIAESTTLNNVPDISGEKREGFQIVPLEERLKNYSGKAWWVPLKTPLTPEEKIIVTNFILKCHADKLPYDNLQAIEAGLDFGIIEWIGYKFGFKKKNDYSKVFCSEILTGILKQINRIDESIDASEIVPKEVVKFPCYQEKYKL